MKRVKKEFLDNDSGAVAAYVAIGIVVFLGFAALVIDIAHMVSVKRELTKAAEAGALAGARGLWPMALWQTSGSRDQTSTDWTRAQTAALNAATSNKADGANLAPSEVTVEIGIWDYKTKQFTPGNNVDDNCCRVTTRRANVQMFLAQFLGISSKDMSATATAIMDFIGAVGQGTLPIVVNQKYSDDPAWIGKTLHIYAGVASNDNGGWFTVPPDSTAASTLSDYINNPDHLCPALEVGQTINLQNGQDTSFLQDLQAKWNAQTSSPKVLDCVIPVVDTNAFNQDGKITGFVSFRITYIKDTGSSKEVAGTVLRNGEVENSLPGGGHFGALAPPKLVQ